MNGTRPVWLQVKNQMQLYVYISIRKVTVHNIDKRSYHIQEFVSENFKVTF